VDSSVTYAPSTDLHNDWAVAESYIIEALEHSVSEQNIFDVMAALERGTGFLWLGKQAAVVTLNQGNTYTLWLAGGKLSGIESMWPSVEEHARGLGATKVVVFGRKGWARTFLRPHGFEQNYVILEKQLWDS